MAYRDSHLHGFWRSLFGATLAALAALAAALLAPGRPLRVALPLFFIAVLLLIGLRYGIGAVVLGSIAATLNFAHFLYAPQGSFAVSDAAERTNLGWMVLGAVIPAYLIDAGHGSHRDN